jgi:hypothetical protein
MTTDCSLNYKFNTWKFQAQTWGEHVVYRNCFWHSEQFLYTTCSPHVLQNEELLKKIYLYSSDTNRQSRISVLNQRFRQSVAIVHGALDDGVLSFITIKVLLWDLAISIGVLIFDFLQGFIKWCLNSSFVLTTFFFIDIVHSLME